MRANLMCHESQRAVGKGEELGAREPRSWAVDTIDRGSEGQFFDCRVAYFSTPSTVAASFSVLFRPSSTLIDRPPEMNPRSCKNSLLNSSDKGGRA